MEETQKSWRSRLTGPALAVLMIACCLAWPLLAGAVGAVTVGAAFGIGAGVIVLLALCLFVGHRLTSNKRC